MYIDRHLAQVWPWRDDARFDAFATVTDITKKIWHTDAYGNEIATLMTDSFDGFPLLVLTDDDGDGEADFYAYYDERREDTTLEFGAYYTEPSDIMPYWLVFNSGPSFDLSDEGSPDFYWINYQFIDRNRDGRFGGPVTLVADGASWTIHNAKGQALGRMARAYAPPDGLDFLRGEKGAQMQSSKAKVLFPRHVSA